MEKKPSLINFGLSLGLVWLISVALDELSPNLNLFVHILLTIIISSVIWSFITSFIFIWTENHKFFKRHEEQVNQMVEDGLSVDDIAKKLRELRDAELEPSQQEEKLNRTIGTVTVVAASKICGYYKDEPIYEKIKLSTGAVFEFEGVVDVSKKINSLNLDPSCIVLASGLIYKLSK